MRSLFIIARWEYLTRIRSKWFIISTLIIPLVLFAFMFVPTLMMDDTGTEMKIIAMIDETGRLGQKFEADIYSRYELKDGQPKYQVVNLDNQSIDGALDIARSLLDSMVIDAYIFIPRDVFKENRVKYYARFLGNYRDQEEIRTVFNTILLNQRAVDANLDPELVKKLTRQIDLDTIEISRRGEQKETNEIISYIIPIMFVLMLYFAIVMSSQVLMRSVLEERNNRLVEILLSSINSTQLMSGKIIGLGLLGLTQLSFYIICGIGLSQYRGMDYVATYQIPFFLLYFVLGYMFFSSIFAAIGAIFSSEQDAQQAVSLISIISVIPILLSSYVIMNPSAPLTIILSHIPFLTPFFMILLIGIDIPPLWHILSTVSVLVLFAGLTMLAAGKIFRTAILMYGKRPTLPEIFQWLKSA